MDIKPAKPTLRGVRGQDPGLQESRGDRDGLRLRLGAGGRLPEEASRKPAARSSRSSGRRSAPPTSAPYLAQIKRDADAVFASMVAASALRFPRQYQDAGLKARCRSSAAGRPSTSSSCPRFGDEAIGGDHATHLQRRPRHAANKRFVTEYREEVRQRSRPTTRRLLHERALDQRGRQGGRRERGRQREIPGRAPKGGDPRRAARADQARR